MPAGSRIRANNVYGLISDNPLSIGATTMNSASLGLLPVVSSAHAVLVLDPKRVFGEPEIVVVTAHTALSSSAVIIRGQYGTTARAHPLNTPWAHVAISEDYIAVVTSSTHPSNPYEGQFIYETDTNNALVYNGGAWVPFGGGGTGISQQPSAPVAALDALWLDTDESAGTGLSSIIAYAERNADPDQTGIVGITDLTGLEVNVAVPAGRRLRITGKAQMNQVGSAGTSVLHIREGGTSLQRGFVSVGAGEFWSNDVSVVIAPTAGTHTYKLSAQAIGGTLTVDYGGDTPAFILVEDITGTLWPAGQNIGSGTVASEAFVAWAPVVTQGVTPTQVNNGSRYYKIGRLVHAFFSVGLTSAGTASTAIKLTLPFPTVSGGVSGTAHYFDAGNTNFLLMPEFDTATTVVFERDGFGNLFGIGDIAIANTDSFNGVIIYEAVS